MFDNKLTTLRMMLLTTASVSAHISFKYFPSQAILGDTTCERNALSDAPYIEVQYDPYYTL